MNCSLSRASGRLTCGLAALSVAVLASGSARAQQELPVIGIDIAPAVIAENAGENAAIGTARRYFSNSELPLSRPLTIRLKNDLEKTLTVPRTVTIPSGQDRITFPVSVKDDAEMNGTRTALIMASADGYFDTYFAASILDDESTFAIKVEPERISEAGGRARVTMSRAATSASVAEEVQLTASVANAVELPEKVRFEAGQVAVAFDVVGKDNDSFDGERVITLTANRSRSNQSTTADFILIDNELDLTIEVPASFAENTASAVFATVSRTAAAAAQGPVTVSVTSSDASEVLGAVGVLMVRGQTSVRVPLQPIDDLVVDGPQVVSLSAQANGYNSDAKTTIVTDNDRPDLQLSLNTASASESAEPSAAWGTLRRNTLTTAPVVVALRSGSARVAVPASVTIPVGAVEARFPIRVVDNTARDGNANVGIVASASGFPSRSATLQVLDNDGPSLQISLTPSQVLEGRPEAARGTVTRLNAPLDRPLSVVLSSSNKDVAVLALAATGNVPTGTPSLSVVIPAGKESASFIVATPDDAMPTDLRTATISATAGGLNAAAVAVDVRDNDDTAELRLSLQALIPSPRSAAKSAANNNFKGPIVEESAGPQALRATVTRNTATPSDLIVQLETVGEVAAPAFVVIPFGQRSVSFFVAAIDDDLSCNQDPDKLSSVVPVVAGYQFVPESLPDGSGNTHLALVLDDEVVDCPKIRSVFVKIVPRIARPNDAIAEIDGPNAATIVVTRADFISVTDPEFGLGLVVDLVSSEPSRAAAVPGLARDVLAANASRSPVSPARIVLLPGSARQLGGQIVTVNTPARLPLSIANDQVQQRCTSISISPVVVGYVLPSQPTRIIPASLVGKGEGFEQLAGAVPVLDTEPEISRLAVSPGVVSESGASGVATGVVRRAPGVTGPLVVTVRTLNEAKVGVSLTERREPRNSVEVTIPEGQVEASFNVIANDNSINDGDVTAFLEASTPCSTAVLRAPVVMRDDDPGQLSMSITMAAGQKSIVEGMPANGLVGMVQRSGNLKVPLVVALRSSDTSELVVPATVTIPAGVARVSFTPRVVDDTLRDGTQRVVVTATAPNGTARQAQVAVNVLDNEK